LRRRSGWPERDPQIKVIVLRGAGRAFSGGYDFGGGFQHWRDATMTMTDEKWDPGKDFAMVTARETGPTHKFMAIWRASKPVIAQVHGWCVGGASDYALCADIVIASDDAVIGTPYSRMWGAYLTGMWLYRLSLAKVKWHSLTGEPLTGIQAADAELINESVPFEQLEIRVAEVAAQLARVVNRKFDRRICHVVDHDFRSRKFEPAFRTPIDLDVLAALKLFLGGRAHGFLDRFDYQFAINALLLAEGFDVLRNARTH